MTDNHAHEPVTIDDINDAIRDRNQAVERAAIEIDEANRAGDRIESLAAAWERQHPGHSLNLNDIDEIDEPRDEIDEIDEDDYAEEDEGED
jgi:hypothetical protein